IKKLQEVTLNNVNDTLDKYQKRQKSIQDDRNLVKEDKLSTGTHVFIMNKPIKGKLEANYLGPYVVVEQAKGGNYKLTTVDGKYVKSLPRNKLKVVPKSDDAQIKFQIENIMDWRTRNGKIEYFVKWLDSPVSENSWIPENHIDNIEAIQEFHGKIHQTSLFSRSLNHSFIMIIMLFMVFITPILCQSIDGMFQYCPSHTKRSLYDLNELDCNHPNVRYGESNEYSMLRKSKYSVDGRGYVCLKSKIIGRTYRPLWGNDEINYFTAPL
ncbi:hypothetical protein BpHYR1_047659, partial [Brachionus plicatilis]